MREKVKYRMYGLVPYNISPIQQGIQFGHAVVEYGLDYGHKSDDPYLQWARNDKTFIILNGGTTNNNKDNYGTLNIAKLNLHSLGVQLSTFHEPDLGDQLTAVVFLVDERVWNKEKYPEWDGTYRGQKVQTGMGPIAHYKNLFAEEGPWVLEMREFLSKYKLA